MQKNMLVTKCVFVVPPRTTYVKLRAWIFTAHNIPSQRNVTVPLSRTKFNGRGDGSGRKVVGFVVISFVIGLILNDVTILVNNVYVIEIRNDFDLDRVLLDVFVVSVWSLSHNGNEDLLFAEIRCYPLIVIVVTRCNWPSTCRNRSMQRHSWLGVGGRAWVATTLSLPSPFNLLANTPPSVIVVQPTTFCSHNACYIVSVFFLCTLENELYGRFWRQAQKF